MNLLLPAEHLLQIAPGTFWHHVSIIYSRIAVSKCLPNKYRQQNPLCAWYENSGHVYQGNVFFSRTAWYNVSCAGVKENSEFSSDIQPEESWWENVQICSCNMTNTFWENPIAFLQVFTETSRDSKIVPEAFTAESREWSKENTAEDENSSLRGKKLCLSMNNHIIFFFFLGLMSGLVVKQGGTAFMVTACSVCVCLCMWGCI